MYEGVLKTYLEVGAAMTPINNVGGAMIDTPLVWAAFDGMWLSLCPLGVFGGEPMHFQAGHVDFDYDLEELSFTLPPPPTDVRLPQGVVTTIKVYPATNPKSKDALVDFMRFRGGELPDYGFHYKPREVVS